MRSNPNSHIKSRPIYWVSLLHLAIISFFNISLIFVKSDLITDEELTGTFFIFNRPNGLYAKISNNAQGSFVIASKFLGHMKKSTSQIWKDDTKTQNIGNAESHFDFVLTVDKKGLVSIDKKKNQDSQKWEFSNGGLKCGKKYLTIDPKLLQKKEGSILKVTSPKGKNNALNPEQLWEKVFFQPIPPSITFYLKSELAPLVVEVVNEGVDNPSPIQLATPKAINPENQLLYEGPDGTLLFVHSRKALDIQSGIGGHIVYTFDKHGRDNQQWKVDTNTGEVINPASNKRLTVVSGDVKPGSHLEAQPINNQLYQKFKKIMYPATLDSLGIAQPAAPPPPPTPPSSPTPSETTTSTPTPPPSPVSSTTERDPRAGYYFIASTLGKGNLVLSSKNSKPSGGDSLMTSQVDLKNPDRQLFKFNLDNTITQLASGKVIGILNPPGGSNVGFQDQRQSSDVQAESQKWVFDSITGSIRSHNATSRVLTIPSDSINSDVPIQLTNDIGAEGQVWKKVAWPAIPSDFISMKMKKSGERATSGSPFSWPSQCSSSSTSTNGGDDSGYSGLDSSGNECPPPEVKPFLLDSIGSSKSPLNPFDDLSSSISHLPPPPTCDC